LFANNSPTIFFLSIFAVAGGMGLVNRDESILLVLMGYALTIGGALFLLGEIFAYMSENERAKENEREILIKRVKEQTRREVEEEMRERYRQRMENDDS
jgi:hypothetical protein